MFLSEPGKTSYDLEFPFFGFPVRVHPAFFIMPILLGQGLIPHSVNAGVGNLMVIVIFFVSILIHELGHAIAYRYYGMSSRIVLYWMGGLAISDSGNVWGRQTRVSLNPNQQIVISLAGPVFGLLLAALLAGLIYAFGGTMIINDLNFMPLPQPILEGTIFQGSELAFMVFFGGIVLNIILNLLNLVPIYPLDGGQVARQIMVQMDGYNGVKNSVILSIACAVLIAVFCFTKDQKFMAFFFGFMAWSNFQTLQQASGPRW